MATFYVWSGGGAPNNGAAWATAYLTLTAAFSGHAAGDTYYVAHDHAESTAAAITLTPLGTFLAPTRVLCVNRAGSVPPVSADLRTTATVSTTGASAIVIAGTAYYYGIIFRSGSAANAASIQMINNAAQFLRFDSCGFTLNNTSGSSRFSIAVNTGHTGCEVQYLNCTFTFGSTVSQTMQASMAGNITFRGGSFVVGASVPTNLMAANANVRLIGVDLSAFGSGKTLITSGNQNGQFLLQDCKLGASVTVAAVPTTIASSVYLVRSDSGDFNYRQEKYSFTGTMTTETTIVRTGGASDGTTAIAWKIVTTADAEWFAPFECPPRVIWNDTTGSRTVTIYGIWGGGAVPLNDEIWIEVNYLGTSGFPLSLLATTTKADILATGSNTTSDSSTWGGSTTKFKMSSTFTVNEKGPIYVTVKAAKVSSTFYVDPEIELT